MNFTDKIDQFLFWAQGKKAATGIVLLFIADIPHLSDITGQPVVDVILYTGKALAGLGVLDKWRRAYKEKKDNNV